MHGVFRTLPNTYEGAFLGIRPLYCDMKSQLEDIINISNHITINQRNILTLAVLNVKMKSNISSYDDDATSS